MSSPAGAPSAGWYPDPKIPNLMRWWDGTSWSDDTYERAEQLDGYGNPYGAAKPVEAAERTAQRRPGQQATTTDDGAELAGWGWRALARVLDNLAIGFVSALVAAPWTVSAFSDALREPIDPARPFAFMTDPQVLQAVGTLGIAQLLVSLAYEMSFLLWKAATPGKLAVGLRVRTWEPGQRLTPSTVIRRWFGLDGLSAIPNVGTFYLILDLLWPLRDVRRQALHDKLAGTCVVRARPSSAAPGAGGTTPGA
ncbi:RDD family protein [Angustibacter aerolatus]